MTVSGEVGGEDAFRSGIVGQYAGSAGWLWVVQFVQRGDDDDGDYLMAVDENATCFCFGCRGNDVLQGFANDLDGSVEWRASGGGVAEVEDSGEATACLGEDEVSCVQFDVEDHVACVELDDCVGMGMEVVHKLCAFFLSFGCCC